MSLVHTGDRPGLPDAGGTLSSIWTLWAQLGILCVPSSTTCPRTQSTWKVDWPTRPSLVSISGGCGLWAPTPSTSDSELSWRCCMMAVLRHCIIHSGYLLRSGEVIPSWRSCPCVDTGDCLGLPHGGTLSSIWTLWAQLGILCSKKHHASPGAQAPSSEFAQSTWKVDWDLSTLEDCCGQPVHLWCHPGRLRAMSSDPQHQWFRVKLKVLYDGSTKTLHHS